ncbi:MAG: alanine racemase, partial [Candidatus Cloacimonadales bacterium]
MSKDRSWTEINLANYRHNMAQLHNFLPANQQIMQIVKADAYGHGAYQIAQEAQQLGIRFLGVANADEGMLLRYQ